MTLQILSHLLEEAFTKTPFFVVLYFIKKYLKWKIKFKSPALVDLQSLSPSSPKHYIYNYRENCHDKIIASVTLHVTKLHVTGFIRVSAALFSNQLKPARIKVKRRHE